MGVVETIDFDNFPKQADKNYKYPSLGRRVRVCYKYDTSRCHEGVIVRDDREEPGETIIKLDNGRYIRATECQYSYIEQEERGCEKMDYQEAIEYFGKELKRDCMVLSPLLEGKKSVRAQFFEIAISAMQELQLYKDSKLCLIPEDVYGKQCSELDEYKQLGTLEEVRAAVEKQKTKKPVLSMNEKSGMFVDYADGHGEYKTQMNNWWRCPCCNPVVGQRVILRYRTHDQRKKKFCENCGQKIDWSVSE